MIKHQPFSHLILTGKNGSGKSTILRNIDKIINRVNPSFSFVKELNVVFSNGANNRYFQLSKKENIYSFLLPQRNSKVNKVESPTKQSIFESQIEQNRNARDFFSKNFKQYLVNKKINQVFAQLENNYLETQETDDFFKKMEGVFGKIFEEDQLKLVFEKENYEFFIKLNDGRKLTFDILPEGFSAFLGILMDLFLRLDLIRKAVGNNTYNPSGIVLIDEPETHLHISLQYHVLPILTTLFPNVQFIVATHSPAVISSIKNATIFDLTTKEILSSDDAISKSFSELMVSHFGLDNEFSDFADDLFEKVNTVLKENKNNIPLRNQQLKAILKENERYISPTMRFELEAKISE
ncbi:MAG: AAA family ATPase [Arcicella sp.]|nr:AAA family ATPase [Arcicella sp.]